MIMVDIYVPSVGRQYNFSLEEQTSISVLTAEISEMICQKEGCYLIGEPEQLTLSCVEKELILSPDASLSQYGIKNGNRLILV